MLQGTFKVTVDGEERAINLFGYDLNYGTVLYGWCKGVVNRRFFDEGMYSDEERVFDPEWVPRFGVDSGTLYMMIGPSTMKVEQVVQDGSKSSPNLKDLSLIGKILRGMRTHCVPKNREDFFEINDFEFQEDKEVIYTVPGGTVTLKNNQIRGLEFKAEVEDVWVEFSLSWNEDIENTLIGFPPDNTLQVSLAPLEMFRVEKDEDYLMLPESGSFFSLTEII